MNDVVIMGSGVADNLAEAYIRKELPELSVAIVGRPDRPSPIVGESTVEYTVHFLQSLGLGPELIEKHYPKYCRTYDYKTEIERPDDPTYVVHESPGILPYPSFQLNRFVDRDLRRRNKSAGVQASERDVVDVQLGQGEPHRVVYRDGRGDSRTLHARWVTGRRRLLGRKLDLHRKPEKGRRVFWFRLADHQLGVPGDPERVDDRAGRGARDGELPGSERDGARRGRGPKRADRARASAHGEARVRRGPQRLRLRHRRHEALRGLARGEASRLPRGGGREGPWRDAGARSAVARAARGPGRVSAGALAGWWPTWRTGSREWASTGEVASRLAEHFEIEAAA